MSRRSRLTARPHLEQLDRRVVLSTALTPSQIESAYGLNAVTFSNGVKGTGAGQTIAIIDAFNDPNATSELATFDSKYGLPVANLNVITPAGGFQTTSRSNLIGWEEEEALDIEAAHLAAPGAKIDLIEAASDSTASLMAAVATANSTAGVTVVSMSWGGSDTTNETSLDSAFTHPGITYLAASGDNGNSPRATPEWPSDSPNVIAVGGTTLTVSTSASSASGHSRPAKSAWSGSRGWGE